MTTVEHIECVDVDPTMSLQGAGLGKVTFIIDEKEEWGRLEFEDPVNGLTYERDLITHDSSRALWEVYTNTFDTAARDELLHMSQIDSHQINSTHIAYLYELIVFDTVASEDLSDKYALLIRNFQVVSHFQLFADDFVPLSVHPDSAGLLQVAGFYQDQFTIGTFDPATPAWTGYLNSAIVPTDLTQIKSYHDDTHANEISWYLVGGNTLIIDIDGTNFEAW